MGDDIKQTEEESVCVVKSVKELFPDEEDPHDDDGDDEEEDDDDDDSGTGHLSIGARSSLHLQPTEPLGSGELPALFQTKHLVFYERFKTYQDYMLGDCKPSEVKAFTADYLEKVMEPRDWRALWHTDVFDVLVEVLDVDYKDLRAEVEVVLPLQCEARGCELSEDSMRTLLEATMNRVPLLELSVVYDSSGDFDQTALALEHLRFFYKHIWRKWDEEDEDDEFDYFVRCVEPRLRLYYDILEDRVPSGLVEEYHTLLQCCTNTFKEFSSLRNVLSSDSDSELDNVSMVEGLRMYEHMETLKRRLRIIENPLLRNVLGYRMNCGRHSLCPKGERPGGGRVVHVVSSSTSVQSLNNLMMDKLLPLYSGKEFELQFHSDPAAAVTVCYDGDVIIVCPGHYIITSAISITDSIQLEGYGLPDEIIIEKRNKGDTFVESIGVDVKISNLKFIQHDAIEGILCVRQGRLEMENCVLQCETIGVIVRTSSQLIMNMCDLYGSKGAGVEIYPGSVCSLVGNGIHHCKEGVVIKDFADELDVPPQITMVNNVIHNNAGYGVILVKPEDRTAAAEAEKAEEQSEGGATTPEGGVTHTEGGATTQECGVTHTGGGATTQECGVTHTGGGATMLEGGDTQTGVRATTSMDGNTQSECGATMEQGGVIQSEGGAVKAEVESACEFTTGNDVIVRELLATSVTKRRAQRNRVRDVGTLRADENLLSQDMFVSIEGNQFRRNGMGSFGTFLY
ncbi:SHC SH2 domain-binding protein 1 [Tachysurus fulvidraco]|uniref:SHC SH2 domain-binding protein 1 n=1 Tax=Tachysurus fulvidraco TaxID=1234273 RepID=UPI000F4E0F1B|nr:SHC SH2 domain-binding protein 1 [Tachysurus fulvidraco]XP_027015999.1 SHC SH2 domain-binding protein 1 [Tachysurus fulvidraco]